MCVYCCYLLCVFSIFVQLWAIHWQYIAMYCNVHCKSLDETLGILLLEKIYNPIAIHCWISLILTTYFLFLLYFLCLYGCYVCFVYSMCVAISSTSTIHCNIALCNVHCKRLNENLRILLPEKNLQYYCSIAICNT